MRDASVGVPGRDSYDPAVPAGPVTAHAVAGLPTPAGHVSPLAGSGADGRNLAARCGRPCRPGRDRRACARLVVGMVGIVFTARWGKRVSMNGRIPHPSQSFAPSGCCPDPCRWRTPGRSDAKRKEGGFHVAGHNSVVLAWLPTVHAVPPPSERAESFRETVPAHSVSAP